MLIQIVPQIFKKYRSELNSPKHAISSKNSFFFWGGAMPGEPHPSPRTKPVLDLPVRSTEVQPDLRMFTE